MKNRSLLFIILIDLFTWSSRAEDFPAVCPSEENFSKICESLEKIDSSKTLAFADGTEMPACLMRTMSPEEKNIALRQRELKYVIMDKLTSSTTSKVKFPNTDEELEKTASLFPTLKTTIDELKQLKVMRKSFSKEVEVDVSKMQDEWSETHKNIISLLQSMNADPLLTKKVSNIQNKFGNQKIMKIDCLQAPNAFFTAFQSDVNFYSAAKALPSQARRIIMAHEIAHRFDPCNITTPENPAKNRPEVLPYYIAYTTFVKDKISNPFGPLINCLRREIGNFEQPELSQKSCEQNHTQEAFCDHISVHIVAESLKNKKYPKLSKDPQKVYFPRGYETIFFHLDGACSIYNSDSSSHPSYKRRLFDIFLRNPSIRKNLGCPVDSSASYCDTKTGLMNSNVVSRQGTQESTKNNVHNK